MVQQHDPLDIVFQKAISFHSIFTNHASLRSDFIPNTLPFRSDQITAIGQTLAPLLRNTKPSNLLIYGKTGTGKTAVTRYTISRLSSICKSQGINAHFAYCNSRAAGTEYRVLVELATTLGLTIPFTGLAVSEVLSRLHQQISSKAIAVILILDEIDYLIKLFGDNLLYSLINTSSDLSPNFFSLVGISNDLHFKDSLDARVLSRLSEEELVFPPYTTTELKTILQDRAKLAFNPGTFTEAAINLCAALSGSEHGDARRAVDLLRISAEVAERDASGTLDEKHVRIALQKIDQDRITDALKTLPLQAKLILLATIMSSSNRQPKASSGSIYNEYVKLCTTAGLDPLTTRRVSGLVTELDTLGLVSAKLVNYGRYGRTKTITPQVSLSTLQLAFESDDTVSQIISSLERN